MKLITRISGLITANVHGLLDRAENPELLARQIVREMEEGLAQAKRFAVPVLAGERRLGRELERNRLQAAWWKTKAGDALAAGREDLARRALSCKREHEDSIRSLERQHAEAVQNSDSVRLAVRALETRLAEARRRQWAILARRRAALAQGEVNRFEGSGMLQCDTQLAQFDRLEQVLAEFEDEVAAQAELGQPAAGLEAELSNLEREKAVDAELAALKQERGLS
jgi:phage shock protein A